MSRFVAIGLFLSTVCATMAFTPEERMDISSSTMFMVDVYGKSVSLGLESNPKDGEIIGRMFNKS